MRKIMTVAVALVVTAGCERFLGLPVEKNITSPDSAQPADLALLRDASIPADASAVSDLSVPADLTADLAPSPDLLVPDLTPPPDLLVPAKCDGPCPDGQHCLSPADCLNGGCYHLNGWICGPKGYTWLTADNWGKAVKVQCQYKGANTSPVDLGGNPSKIDDAGHEQCYFVDAQGGALKLGIVNGYSYPWQGGQIPFDTNYLGLGYTGFDIMK